MQENQFKKEAIIEEAFIPNKSLQIGYPYLVVVSLHDILSV